MNNMFLWVVLITLVAGVGGTGLGGLVSICLKYDSKRIVSLFLSFAGGIMLSVVCFDLIMEAIAPESPADEVGIYTVIAGIAIGYVVVWLLNYFIDKSTNPELEHIDGQHPKTADDLDELIHSDHQEKHLEERSSLFVAGLIMAAAIALHNLPEGMVIGSAYVGGEVEGLWTGSGFVMACLIGLHNVPEGMAITVPLVAGGMKRGRAVLITALSGLPTVFGAMLGYWLGSMGPLMHALSLSFASGAMLYVVFGELLPEAILMWRSKLPAVSAVIGMAVGLIILYA